MATQYVISFRDGRPLGGVDAMQSLIRSNFPSVTFQWTTSGMEKLRTAKDRGIEFPPELRRNLETLPSVLEGSARGDGWRVGFGLGSGDPVIELIIEPRGTGTTLEHGISQIEKALGMALRVHGTPAAL